MVEGVPPLFGNVDFFDFNYFTETQILIPLTLAVFVGTNVGKQVLRFLSEKVYHLLFRGALTIIAIKLIIDQLMLLL